MANNHQLQHGLIIDELKDVVSARVKAGIKFQFRDLSTFVHPGHRETSPNKHVSRFASTRLDWNEYATLHKAVKQAGMLSICTPFDEASVARIVEIGFDILKIASCSANDRPLLGAAADSGLPIIASTGGLLQEEMDALVSFLDHRGCDYALMHCVSIYLTPAADCNLGNIGTFKQRYPNRVIGWSTHEDPDEIARSWSPAPPVRRCSSAMSVLSQRTSSSMPIVHTGTGRCLDRRDAPCGRAEHCPPGAGAGRTGRHRRVEAGHLRQARPAGWHDGLA